MSTTKRIAGYTLTELVITVAIIGILGALVFGAFSKEAGATTPSPIPDKLREQSVQFMYSSTGTLTVFNTGGNDWDSAQSICNALKPLDNNLRKVYFSQAKSTTTETELVWNDDHTELTNLDGLTEAICN